MKSVSKLSLSLSLRYNSLFFFQTQPSCFIVSYLITPVLTSLQSPGISRYLCFWRTSLVTGAWSCHLQFMEFPGDSPVSDRANWLALKDTSLRVPKGHFFLRVEQAGKWNVVRINARVLKKKSGYGKAKPKEYVSYKTLQFGSQHGLYYD